MAERLNQLDLSEAGVSEGRAETRQIVRRA
jgi:hypothetical protein